TAVGARTALGSIRCVAVLSLEWLAWGCICGRSRKCLRLTSASRSGKRLQHACSGERLLQWIGYRLAAQYCCGKALYGELIGVCRGTFLNLDAPVTSNYDRCLILMPGGEGKRQFEHTLAA